MNKQAVVAAVIALLIGLGAGGLGTYSWLEIRHQGRSAEHQNHDDQKTRGGETHDEHAHADEGEPIRLTPTMIAEAGIEIAEVTGGQLERTISLPGEIVLNADHLAHIMPRVSGMVRNVTKSVGDHVEPDEVLASLESRELSEAKAIHLAAKQRLAVAQANVAANEELKAKGIVADLEFLATQRELAEAEIEQRTAEFKLHTLGLTAAKLPKIEEHGRSFATYELRAPFAGTIIDRHMTLGELVTPESTVFVLADLSTVWVRLTVYQKDLPVIRVGQAVTVLAGPGIGEGSATIDYISPLISEATRTAVARMTLPNPDGRWRPGLFVTGRPAMEHVAVHILVPKTALQVIGEETCVFVQTDRGFQTRDVEVGRTDADHVEITAGLAVGESYVAQGGFALKAEIVTSGIDPHAGHGH